MPGDFSAEGHPPPPPQIVEPTPEPGQRGGLGGLLGGAGNALLPPPRPSSSRPMTPNSGVTPTQNIGKFMWCGH